MTIPTEVPSSVRAGDTLQFTLALGDYPADSWTLAFVLKILSNGTTSYSFDAVAVGTGYSVEVAAADTALWPDGTYRLIGRATSNTGVVKTVTQSTIQVLPDLASVGDFRSHEERMLELVTAAIEASGGSDIIEYTVGSRTIKKSKTWAQQEQQRLIWLVRKQRGTAPGFYGATFGDPS